MNLVMTSGGNLVEVQGTAEHKPFDRATLDRLLALADEGIRQMIQFQREIVGAMIKTPQESGIRSQESGT